MFLTTTTVADATKGSPVPVAEVEAAGETTAVTTVETEVDTTATTETKETVAVEADTETTEADAAAIGGLGYAVVFFGLILLMLVIMITGKIMSRKKVHAEEEKPKISPKQQPLAAKESDPAPGSAGEIKLHDVSDRDAAMIMAITANKLGRPLNELRFKSIKEVK